MKLYDLIVIGCGGVGSAVLYSAAQRGLKTLCIEQFEQDHKKGSTHGETRAFRMAYYEAPDYIPLLKQAYLQWKDLEKQSHEILLVDNGVLEIGFEAGETIASSLKNAQKYGIHIEKLYVTQINHRFPGFNIPEGMIGILQKQAGFLYVEKCVNQFIRLATRREIDILYREKVISWTIDSNKKVLIKTDKDTYMSKYLIITAGSWSSEILNELNLPLTILQKKLIWLKSKAEYYSIEAGSPCFAYYLPEGIFYGFPAINNHIKVARHSGGTVLKIPEDNSVVSGDEETNAIKEFANTYLEAIFFDEFKEANCLYTNTPDHQFIIDKHPKYSQVAFAAGLSGHGYKMCNVLGEILVDLVIKDKCNYDISFLSLKRFL